MADETSEQLKTFPSGSEDPRTPEQLLIRLLEDIDDIENVVVIYQRKGRKSCSFWSNNNCTFWCIGIVTNALDWLRGIQKEEN